MKKIITTVLMMVTTQAMCLTLTTESNYGEEEGRILSISPFHVATVKYSASSEATKPDLVEKPVKKEFYKEVVAKNKEEAESLGFEAYKKFSSQWYGVTDCTFLKRKGFKEKIYKCLWTYYNEQLSLWKQYQEDLAKWEKSLIVSNKLREKAKKTKVKTSIKFRKMSSSLTHFVTDVKTSNLGAFLSKLGDKDVEGVAKLEPYNCYDEDGNYHSLTTETYGLDFSQLIDLLFEDKSIEMTKCALEFSSYTLKGYWDYSTGISFSKKKNVLAVDYTGTISYFRKGSFPYIPASHSFNFKVAEQKDVTEYNDELVQQYLDFIKYEYGMLLMEIYEEDLNKVKATMKIRKFLFDNKDRIKGYIQAIKNDIKDTNLLTKASVMLKVKQAYVTLKAIEEKVKTSIRLDHIVD